MNEPPLERRAVTPDELERARELYATDDIAIDDDALVSSGDPLGVWFSAWVYVPAPDDQEGDA